MLNRKRNITEYIPIVLLYTLTIICFLFGVLGYTTIAMLIFAVMLISGSILGFIKKAITFLPIRTTTSSFTSSNNYKGEGIIMCLIGYLINGLTLLFGLYIAYFVFFSVGVDWLR